VVECRLKIFEVAFPTISLVLFFPSQSRATTRERLWLHIEWPTVTVLWDYTDLIGWNLAFAFADWLEPKTWRGNVVQLAHSLCNYTLSTREARRT